MDYEVIPFFPFLALFRLGDLKVGKLARKSPVATTVGNRNSKRLGGNLTGNSGGTATVSFVQANY
jgi:hypothetical protein